MIVNNYLNNLVNKNNSEAYTYILVEDNNNLQKVFKVLKNFILDKDRYAGDTISNYYYVLLYGNNHYKIYGTIEKCDVNTIYFEEFINKVNGNIIY